MAPTLQVIIGAKTDALTSALDTIQSRVSEFGSRLKSAGLEMSAGLTLPLVAAGTEALKTSSSFEAAMTKIETLVGVSRDQVQAWAADLQKLGPALGKSPQELADALYFITSDGLRGAQAIDVLTMSAKAAEMGLGRVDDVAATVTAAINAYGKENLTASQAVDQLTATVTQGKMRSEELAGEFGRILPIAAEVGVSFAQAGGFIATFTRLGVNSAEAITALRAVLLAVIKPAKQSEEALAEVGMSAADLKSEIQDKGLAGALVDLVQKFEAIGDVDALAKVIPNVRGLAGALAVAKSQGDTFLDVTKKIEESVGNTDRGFQTFQGTTKYTWDQLTSSIETTATAFGNDLAPSFKQSVDAALPLLDAAKGLAKAFADLPAPVQTTAIGLTAVAAAMGPLMYLGGNLLTIFGKLSGLLSAGASGIGALLGSSGLAAGGAVGGGLAIGLGIGSYLESFRSIRDAIDNDILALRGFDLKTIETLQRVKDLSAGMDEFYRQFPQSGKQGDITLTPEGYVKGPGISAYTTETGPVISPAAKKAAEQMQKLVDSITSRISGGDVEKTLHAWFQALEQIGGVYNLPETEQSNLNHTLKEALDLYDALGKTAPQAWRDTYEATLPVLESSDKLKELFANNTLALMPTGTNGIGIAAVDESAAGDDLMARLAANRQMGYAASIGIGASLGHMDYMMPTALQSTGGLFSNFLGSTGVLAQLGPTVLHALEGGGNVAGSIGGLLGGGLFSSVGKKLSNTLTGSIDSTLGGALGSIIPGVGTLLGGVLGKLFGGIGGPSKQELQGRQVEGDFEKSFGGLQQMGAAIQTVYLQTGRTIQQAQADVQALLNAEKQGGAAVQQIIDKINVAFTQAQNVKTGVDGLTNAVKAAGGSIPHDLLPIVQSFLQMKGLTDDEKQALQDLVDASAPNFQQLEQTAAKYGITLEGLGPKFQQAHIDDEAKTLFKDFQDLTDAGGDVGGVLLGMSTSINQLVLDAKHFGVAIPENMRPLIENLLDAGKLTDENGQKLKDLSGITWEDTPIDKGTQKIVDAINHLADILTGLPANAANAAAGIGNALGNINVPTIDIHYRYDADNGLPGLAAGGIVTRPTVALIGEAGPEAVVPLSKLGAMGGGTDPEVKATLIRLHRVLDRLPTQFRDVIQQSGLVGN